MQNFPRVEAYDAVARAGGHAATLTKTLGPPGDSTELASWSAGALCLHALDAGSAAPWPPKGGRAAAWIFGGGAPRRCSHGTVGEGADGAGSHDHAALGARPGG